MKKASLIIVSTSLIFLLFTLQLLFIINNHFINSLKKQEELIKIYRNINDFKIFLNSLETINYWSLEKNFSSYCKQSFSLTFYKIEINGIIFSFPILIISEKE
ncbi:MAG: hypothetical protein QXF09_02060 [Nitrososphaerota archaeon]